MAKNKKIEDVNIEYDKIEEIYEKNNVNSEKLQFLLSLLGSDQVQITDSESHQMFYSLALSGKREEQIERIRRKSLE